jgi:ABC-type multidrug transport system ATPase subunit
MYGLLGPNGAGKSRILAMWQSPMDAASGSAIPAKLCVLGQQVRFDCRGY